MTTVGLTLIISLVIFLVIGVPIAFSLGLAAFLAILVKGTLPTMIFS
jgi:C4-dicarboxylate transporter DctM subunit